MWNCVRCGEKVDDGFEVCWSCGTSVDGVEDPYFDSEADTRIKAADPQPLDPSMPGQKLVTVGTFDKAAEAHAVRCRLEAEGLAAFLSDEFIVSMDWFLSNAVGGIKVQVPENEVERALEILEAHGPDGEEPDDEGEDEVEPEERFTAERPRKEIPRPIDERFQQ